MDEDDAERVLSGKLSESSGYAGSDLYDYKVSWFNFLDTLNVQFVISNWYKAVL